MLRIRWKHKGETMEGNIIGPVVIDKKVFLVILGNDRKIHTVEADKIAPC